MAAAENVGMTTEEVVNLIALLGQLMADPDPMIAGDASAALQRLKEVMS